MRLCEHCYWLLSGCLPEETVCEYFYPVAIGEDLTEPEREYDAGPNADAWGQAGFSVIELPVGNPEGDNGDEVCDSCYNKLTEAQGIQNQRMVMEDAGAAAVYHSVD